VGDWYEIGMTLGLGVAAGLLLAGLVAAWRYGVLVSTLGALAIGAVAGLLIKGWIGLPGALVGALIGAVSASIVARGALRRGATAGGTAFLVGSASIFIAMLALIPLVGYVIAVVVPAVAARRARQEPERHAGLRSLARSARKLVLVLIDGLTPTMLEGSLGTATAPTLTALAEQGTLGRATTTFPSLTPVCLSSLATGAHPDVHEIPHLVWWHRGERRLVEYGSSFGAARAAGLGRTLRDTLVGMNAEHLGRSAVTVFEALADAGLATAAVNFTAYRGRTPHRATVPFLGTVRGPERFYFYNLFQSERTGAPLSFRKRAAGTIDAYAAAVGRWLVTRDGFDFLLFYLSDYDYASHAAGPDAASAVLTRCDEAVGGLVRAAGGLDAFVERYAVVVMSDHGQSSVREVARLGDRFRHAEETLVAASNRAGHVYRLGPSAPTARELAERLDGDPSVEVALFREGDAVVARREGEEARIEETRAGRVLAGDASILDQPDAVARAVAAVGCPNAGEVLVSARDGWEFHDLGGGHHLGGGSHGSLTAADSLVPVLTVGLGAAAPRSVVDVAPLVLDHFGVAAPPYVLRRAA
jgi:hypothetical protein